MSSAWSNVDLFQQFNEASKDSYSAAHNSAVQRQKTYDLVVTDDEELDNYLANEDFQCFNVTQSQSCSDHSVVDGTRNSGNRSAMNQKDPENSVSPQEVIRDFLPGGGCSTQKRVGKGSSSEVEIAQTIARSRLRDFNLNAGRSQSLLVFHRSCTGSVSDARHEGFKTLGPSTFSSTAASEQEFDSCTET